MINDRFIQSVVPIEVKPGKGYRVHTAIYNFVNTPDYGIKRAFVVSNNREVALDGMIAHIPIYFTPFL